MTVPSSWRLYFLCALTLERKANSDEIRKLYICLSVSERGVQQMGRDMGSRWLLRGHVSRKTINGFREIIDTGSWAVLSSALVMYILVTVRLNAMIRSRHIWMCIVLVGLQMYTKSPRRSLPAEIVPFLSLCQHRFVNYDVVSFHFANYQISECLKCLNVIVDVNYSY